MAATTIVRVDTYLHTSYRPDREYIDGEVQERNLGEHDHARLQLVLGAIFFANEAKWGIRAYADWRTQVAATRFRVPDLVVVEVDLQREPILHHPPLIAVEILSPEDTIARMRQRIEDFQRFGISNIWVIDPGDQTGYVCHGPGFGDWEQTRRFVLADRDIEIDLDDLFRRL